MAQKKSINEIWAELNAKPGPRKSSIPAGIPIPGISSTSSSAISKAGSKPGPNLNQLVNEEMSADSSAAEAVRKTTATYDPSKAGLTQEEVAGYVASIQRLVNCLGDPDRGTRRCG
jgi:hypothetical protein